MKTRPASFQGKETQMKINKVLLSPHQNGHILLSTEVVEKGRLLIKVKPIYTPQRAIGNMSKLEIHVLLRRSEFFFKSLSYKTTCAQPCFAALLTTAQDRK